MPTSDESPARAGFHGKLPCNGDFVQRGLPPDFVAAWDPWLQRGVDFSRRQLGAQWVEVYRTSPVWRFSLSPGTCGAQGYAGILVPSVDRVGRYFPIAIVRSLLPHECALNPVLGDQAWFDSAVAIAADALGNPPQSLEEFRAAVLTLEPRHDEGAFAPGAPMAAGKWRHLQSLAGLAADVAAVAHAALGAELRPVSYWWTDGSDRVPAGWCVFQGMPDERRYAEFLSGFADGRGAGFAQEGSAPYVARPAPMAGPEPAEAGQQIPVVTPEPGEIVSAAVTHRGKVYDYNQDAHLQRADLGLWVVADGVGGGSDGDRASQSVCDILGLLPHALTLNALTDEVKKALQTVNAELREDAVGDDDLCASTIVALMIRQDRYAAVWAGDSRLYLLRDARLNQLTHDHNATEGVRGDEDLGTFGDLLTPADNVISRAVGSADELQLEEIHGEVRSGDRFLLCSDGIYKELAEREIAAALSEESEPEAVCERLRELVLSRKARDNLTAVVVYA